MGSSENESYDGPKYNLGKFIRIGIIEELLETAEGNLGKNYIVNLMDSLMMMTETLSINLVVGCI